MRARAGLIAPAAALAAVWAVATTTGPTADTSISDLPLYRFYADRLGDGASPYGDLGFEYPPLALVPIRLGGAFGPGATAYAWTFGTLMLGAALAALVLTGRLAGGRRTRAMWLVAGSPLLAGALVRTHFDFVPVGLALGGLLGVARGRPVAGFGAFGLGAMTKLFPALLVPVAVGWLIGRGERRAAARGVAAFLAVVVALSLPFASTAYLDAYRFHAERPVQIESTPASVLFALGGSRVTGTTARPDRFRSQGLDGGAAVAVQAAFAALLVALLAGVSLLAATRGDERGLVLCAFAALLGFVALGKVLSPQFVIWLVPFAALAWTRGERAVAALCAAAILLTQVEFPSRYWDLVARDGGVVGLVAARNALLVVALTTLLARLAGPARWRRPAAASMPVRPRP